MRAVRNLSATLSLLAWSCRGFDEGDLTEPPDGSHCPAEAPAWCDATCVDLSSDLFHCGICGRACNNPPNGEAISCVDGACSIAECAGGFDDCDGDFENGCEADLL